MAEADAQHGAPGWGEAVTPPQPPDTDALIKEAWSNRGREPGEALALARKLAAALAREREARGRSSGSETG
jgi:hypothetical protein